MPHRQILAISVPSKSGLGQLGQGGPNAPYARFLGHRIAPFESCAAVEAGLDERPIAASSPIVVSPSSSLPSRKGGAFDRCAERIEVGRAD